MHVHGISIDTCGASALSRFRVSPRGQPPRLCTRPWQLARLAATRVANQQPSDGPSYDVPLHLLPQGPVNGQTFQPPALQDMTKPNPAACRAAGLKWCKPGMIHVVPNGKKFSDTPKDLRTELFRWWSIRRYMYLPPNHRPRAYAGKPENYKYQSPRRPSQQGRRSN